MNFYTADLHFGQESLLATGKWKERPFSTLEEMHKDQIKKWNKKVTPSCKTIFLSIFLIPFFVLCINFQN